MASKMKIIYHVYEIRTAKNISLRTLEELSDISRAQINNIENGKKHPTVYTLCKLSHALNVLPQDLFSWKVEECLP